MVLLPLPCRSSRDLEVSVFSPADAASPSGSQTSAGQAAAPVSTAELQGLPPAELARRLNESQQMVARFSRENERLAQHAEQLRGSKQVVANDYKGEPQVKSIPACCAMPGQLWGSEQVVAMVYKIEERVDLTGERSQQILGMLQAQAGGC